jgi:glycosyltransferase involved in cell wall biosynthesis
MSYHANIAAATYLLDDIMPLVWAENPDLKLWIVGKDPPGSLRKRAQSNGARVTITGTVPDIRPYIQKAGLAVVPILYGAGSQVKIIEAMACGTPVVASPRAVSALDVRVGRDVAVAESAHSMAESIVNLLQDPKGLQEMSQAGRTYVETHHDWKKIAARLGGLYDEIA